MATSLFIDSCRCVVGSNSRTLVDFTIYRNEEALSRKSWRYRKFSRESLSSSPAFSGLRSSVCPCFDWEESGSRGRVPCYQWRLRVQAVQKFDMEYDVDLESSSTVRYVEVNDVRTRLGNRGSGGDRERRRVRVSEGVSSMRDRTFSNLKDKVDTGKYSRSSWTPRDATKGNDKREGEGPSVAIGLASIRKVKISKEMTSDQKFDKVGHLRSPRAGRELALCILYAAFVADVSPLEVFYQRMKQRAGWDFEKAILEHYSHSPADIGENATEDDEARATELMKQQEEEAAVEAGVLTAPLPLIYNKNVIDQAKRLLKATIQRWQQQETTLLEYLPIKWKNEPMAARLPYCILQLALAELEITDSSPKVVINEAVDLTKRFCDGTAPRVVNGCLGRYSRVRDAQKLQSGHSLSK